MKGNLRPNCPRKKSRSRRAKYIYGHQRDNPNTTSFLMCIIKLLKLLKHTKKYFWHIMWCVSRYLSDLMVTSNYVIDYKALDSRHDTPDYIRMGFNEGNVWICTVICSIINVIVICNFQICRSRKVLWTLFLVWWGWKFCDISLAHRSTDDFWTNNLS